MIDNIVGSIKKLTEAGMALIALAIVLEVIFGANVAFVGVGVVENVLSIVGTLGGEGLVGLASIAVIYALFNRKQSTFSCIKAHAYVGFFDSTVDKEPTKHHATVTLQKHEANATQSTETELDLNRVQ